MRKRASLVTEMPAEMSGTCNRDRDNWVGSVSDMNTPARLQAPEGTQPFSVAFSATEVATQLQLLNIEVEKCYDRRKRENLTTSFFIVRLSSLNFAHKPQPRNRFHVGVPM